MNQFMRISFMMVILLSLLAPYWHHLTPEHEHESFIHSHECSPEIEKDACHQRLVHHNSDKGCQHGEHVTEIHNHCELCAPAHNRKEFLLSNALVILQFKSCENKPVNKTLSPELCLIYVQKVRGPPLLYQSDTSSFS